MATVTKTTHKNRPAEAMSWAWPPICVALVTRIAWLAYMLGTRGQSALLAPDSASYLDSGRTLLHGHFGWPVPDIDRTPGYPLFAALTGIWNGHIVGTAIAQILLECVSVWLILRIARQLSGSDQVARLAGFLYAIDPLAIRFSCLILSDTLYITVLLAATSFLLDYRREARWNRLAYAWIFLVASAYVRPTSYYLPFVVAAYLLLQPRDRSLRQRLKAATATVLVCMSLLGVWQVRNKLVSGYGGFSSVKEINLYYYLAAGVQANLQHRTLSSVQDEYKVKLETNPNSAAWSRGQELAFMKREAVHTIAQHPWVYFRLHAIGMAHVLFGPNVESIRGWKKNPNERRNSLVSPERSAESMLREETPATFVMIAAMVIFELACYAYALRGLMRGWQGLVVLLVLYFAIISGGPQADSRYRLPLIPFVCALAAIGFIGQSSELRLRERTTHSPLLERSAVPMASPSRSISR